MVQGKKISELPTATEPVATGDRLPFVDASDTNGETRLKTRYFSDFVSDVAAAVKSYLEVRMNDHDHDMLYYPRWRIDELLASAGVEQTTFRLSQAMTAGTFVGILADGTIAPAGEHSAGLPVSTGARTHAVAALSETTFVVFFIDGTEHVFYRIGTLAGNVVTLGSPQAFDPSIIAAEVELCALSPDLVVIRLGGRLVAGRLMGGNLSFTEVLIPGGSGPMYRLSDTDFLMSGNQYSVAGDSITVVSSRPVGTPIDLNRVVSANLGHVPWHTETGEDVYIGVIDIDASWLETTDYEPGLSFIADANVADNYDVVRTVRAGSSGCIVTFEDTDGYLCVLAVPVEGTTPLAGDWIRLGQDLVIESAITTVHGEACLTVKNRSYRYSTYLLRRDGMEVSVVSTYRWPEETSAVEGMASTASNKLLAVHRGTDYDTASLAVLNEEVTMASIAGCLQQDGAAGESKAVALVGSVSNAHSGLQPGRTYYLDGNALTLTKTSFPVGLALSDKSLLLTSR